MRILAEAAASNDRVALDRMLIDQLPQIVKEAAGGLAGANVNVLNGAEGLSELAAGLVGQGLTILDSIKKNLASSPESPAANSPSGNGPAPEGSPDPSARPAIELNTSVLIVLVVVIVVPPVLAASTHTDERGGRAVDAGGPDVVACRPAGRQRAPPAGELVRRRRARAHRLRAARRG
jgi:hypothetical protein